MTGMADVGGERVEIGWEQARETNRRNWDNRAQVHEAAYGLERFADPDFISSVVSDDARVLREHLGPGGLKGLDLIHLQCHLGTDTVSLARLGATVTGLDFSPASLAVARRLAEDAGAKITWVDSDVLAARSAVEGHFDVVYTSIGAITWLKDLEVWAQQISALLRPGGVFYIRDGHASLYSLDEDAPDLRIAHAYFGDGRAQRWDNEFTYAGEGKLEHTESFEWPHPVSEVVTVLLRGGLVLERFDEGATLPWRFSGRMVEVAPGRYAWPAPERNRVPCTFTLVARKPSGDAQLPRQFAAAHLADDGSVPHDDEFVGGP